jgi:Arc/MetJ family transcription regulator
MLDNAYILSIMYACEEKMRTTIDIPEKLVNEAMLITNIHTKTDVIKEALVNLIQKEKVKKIKSYKGKIDLNIDLNIMRKR